MKKKLTDMNPVDDFVTRNTPGLKIWDERWGGMQCAYHVFAPGTDFTDILKGKGLEHDHPVQHRWRVGCARQENPGVCRETDEEVSVYAA
jgi:hypothetical protein